MAPVSLRSSSFFQNIWIGLNEAYLLESMALVMIVRLILKKAGGLYSSYVSADVRVNTMPVQFRGLDLYRRTYNRIWRILYSWKRRAR